MNIVVLLNIICFNEIIIGLYSFVAIYIIEKMLDIIFEGINFSKAIYIISDKSEDISKEIIAELKKGVTGFYGKGMFHNNDKLVLMCVTKRRNIVKIKEVAKKIDKNSFIIVFGTSTFSFSSLVICSILFISPLHTSK